MDTVCSVFWEPSYATCFRCDGNTCGSQCCRNWRIPVDDRSWQRYQAIPEEAARAAVLNAVREIPATDSREFILQDDGRCPFLRNDLLCRLQCDYGEAALTDICWQYPRVLYLFPNQVESALTISCPVAAKLILREEPLRFHHVRRPLPSGRTLLQPAPAVLAMGEVVFSLQRSGIALLQERRFSLDLRLLALYRLAERADEAARQFPAQDRLSVICRDSVVPDFIETLLAAPPAFDLSASLQWRVRLMGTLYEHPFPPEKTAALTAACAASYPAFRREVRQRYAPLLENYFVNEFFLRLYPFAFRGSFTRNIEIFLVTEKLIEIGLLAAYTQKGGIDQSGFIAILVRVAGHLDHNTMGMCRVVQAVDELHAAGVSVPGLMIDGGA